MGLRDKCQTVLWFLRRPGELGELPRYLRHRFNGPPQHSESMARDWCRARCVSESEALVRLTGKALPAGNTPSANQQATSEPASNGKRVQFSATPFALESKFPAEFAAAMETARHCPVDFGGPGLLDLLYGVVEHWRPQRVLETGVAYGWSTLAILLALEKIPGARLISGDLPFGGPENAAHVGCVVPEALRGRWRLIQRPDRESLPEVFAEWPQIDMCHYDSDKSYFGRMWAARLIWPALRPGGIFLFDDINDNFAYRDFCVEVNQTPLVVGHRGKESGKFSGVLVKPSGRGQ